MASPKTYRVRLTEYTPDKLESRITSLVEWADWAEPAQCAVAVIAATGIRPGELLALSWGDLDLTTGIARIRKTYTGDGLRPAKVQRVEALPPLAVAALSCLREAHRATSQGNRAEEPSASDPVICSESGARMTRRELSSWWQRKRGDFCMSHWQLGDLRTAHLILTAHVAEVGR